MQIQSIIGGEILKRGGSCKKRRYFSLRQRPEVSDMGITDSYTIIVVDSPYNYENATYGSYGNATGDCTEELSLQSLKTVCQLVYVLTFLLGVTGNGLMVTVLLRRRRLLRITETYLLHLALADLMLLLTLPFQIVEVGSGWLFGEFLCKLTGLSRRLNLLCGSFLLACIGFDRYLAVVHAVSSLRGWRPRTAAIVCPLWLVCLGLSVPDAVFLSVKNIPEVSAEPGCDYHDYVIHGYNWVLANSVLNHVFFFLPLAIMGYCYTALVVFLRASRKRQAKQSVTRLCLMVTLVFCFCWLPHNVALLVKTLADFDVVVYETCWSYNLLLEVLEVSRSLGVTHCCLNPFLYAFVGVRFRKEVLQMLRLVSEGTTKSSSSTL